MKHILLCFNLLNDAKYAFLDLIKHIREHTKNAKINQNRMTIEYDGYFVEFCHAEPNKIAGKIYEYYWSDSYACDKYLRMNYHGHDLEGSELQDWTKVLDILGL